ncbi:MAG: hypothetical protein JXL81_08225, partial [Deltaproteobacteria bacterium]|nr:hypothetical protein [Deltaproteobacteria bacterium]
MKRLFKKILPILLLFTLFQSQAIAHDVSIPVIVDTDMALDDIRAITMLLNSEVARIPVFIVSDGVRSPDEGIKNLKAILEYFNRGDIPAAKGLGLDKNPPEVRSYIRE